MDSQLINRVIELTNLERTKAGLKPLTLNNQLAEAAQGHSDSMATDDFFAHTGADGSTVGDRVKGADYVFARTGENIAAGQKTAEQVVEGWMNSPGHRANILNGAYTEIGIGYKYLENDTGEVNYNSYWTQVFGTPQGNVNQGNTSEPTQPIETDSEPVLVIDNNNNNLEPEPKIPPQESLQPEQPVLNEESAPLVEELIEIEPAPVIDNSNNNLEPETEITPQESLQPEQPVLNEEPAPLVEELIEIEPAPIIDNSNNNLEPETEITPQEPLQPEQPILKEEPADSSTEVLDNKTNNLEPSNQQDDGGKDYVLFGETIGSVVNLKADYQSGDLSGHATGIAVAGGDAVMSFGQGTNSLNDKLESAMQHYAEIADTYTDYLGTSEFNFDNYESDLFSSTSSYDFSYSHEQKPIAAVESMF